MTLQDTSIFVITNKLNKSNILQKTFCIIWLYWLREDPNKYFLHKEAGIWIFFKGEINYPLNESETKD